MSRLDPAQIRFEEALPAASNWSHVLKRGTTLRITALADGANVAALFYNFELLCERLNLPDTLKCQHTARLTTGHCLYSDMGRVLVSITDDTCGWHDPLGGASNESGTSKRYGELSYQSARNKFHRNAHDSFLVELGKYGMGERDLAMNVNFFSKVTADAAGGLSFEEGHARAGAYVDLRAEMNTLVILNSCMHPMDPKTSYAPQGAHLTVWSSPEPTALDACRMSCPENSRGFTLTERYYL